MEAGKIIGKGAQSDVYESANYAIKVFKPGYGKAEVFYEAAVTSLIEQTGLPIAKVYEVISMDNQLAIKMDYIKGIPFHDYMMQDVENIIFYIKTMVDIQLSIHSKIVNLPFNLSDILKSRIEHNNKIDNLTRSKLLTRLENLPRGTQLCHGDFHGYNIIKNDNGYFIIDWIDAANGYPDADACRTYMLYATHHQELADLYLNCYCSKTGKTQETVLEWLPIIAAARINEGNMQYLKEEVDKLMAWVHTI